MPECILVYNLCLGDTNIKEYHYELNSDTESEDDTPELKDVNKVKEWYFLYEHKSDMPSHIPEDSDIISMGDQLKNLYHERYYIKVQN